MWSVRGVGKRQPYVRPKLRNNFGSGLSSVFLARLPRFGVPANMANHRVVVSAWAGDLGRMQNSSQRHGRFRVLVMLMLPKRDLPMEWQLLFARTCRLAHRPLCRRSEAS